MSVIDTIMTAADEFPVRFQRGEGGVLTLEAVVGQRVQFFSRRSLTYRCRLRVDDQARRITFHEALVETARGASGEVDLPSGVAFRRKKYRTGVVRGIGEQSRLFGQNYVFDFHYERVRVAAERAAQIAGYEFKPVLHDKSV